MMDLRCGDTRELLKAIPDASVQTCITSPPYFGLRDYGVSDQIGLESTPEAYVSKLVDVFRDVRRVLKDDGTLWLNLGDSYAGYWGDKKAKADGRPSSADTNGWTNGFNMLARPQFDFLRQSGLKPKDLIGIPWMVAFALRADGWYLRQDIIWHKPNPMPESIKDRCTKAHEYVFLLSKSQKYYFDAEAIKEPCVTSAANQVAKRNKRPHKGQSDAGMRETTGGFDKITKVYETRNRRSVWTVTTKPYRGAHFATFPLDLVTPMVLAGCPEGGTVLDPFSGAATTGLACQNTNRNYIGLELNPAYVELATARLDETKDATTL